MQGGFSISVLEIEDRPGIPLKYIANGAPIGHILPQLIGEKRRSLLRIHVLVPGEVDGRTVDSSVALSYYGKCCLALAGHGPLPLVTATEPFTASVSAKSMIFHFELVSKFRKIALFMLYYFQKGLFCSIYGRNLQFR